MAVTHTAEAAARLLRGLPDNLRVRDLLGGLNAGHGVGDWQHSGGNSAEPPWEQKVFAIDCHPALGKGTMPLHLTETNNAIVISCFRFKCLWILVYFAQSVEYLYAGRLLAGICGGGMYIVHPIFLSEIADAK